MHSYIEIKKAALGQYSVTLMVPEGRGYWAGFGKYFGKSLKKARQAARNNADLYGCKIQDKTK